MTIRSLILSTVSLMLISCGNAEADAAAGPVDTPRNAPLRRAVANAALPVETALQTVEIVDRQGFGQPIVAATIRVPAGWRTEGGVGWDRSGACVTNHLKMQWRASSADGGSAFEFMPGYSWQIPAGAMQMNPCPVAAIQSTRAFLTIVAQQMRPGAQITGYRDRPDIARSAQRGALPGSRVEAGELMLSYGGQGDRTQEILVASVYFSDGLSGLVSYVTALRAPAGRLDPAHRDRIEASMKGNPQFLAMMRDAGNAASNRHASQQSNAIQSWHAGRMAQINAAGAADRAAIRAQGNRDVAAINAQTYANTSATNDRINENTRQALNQESIWVNPNSGASYQGSIHGAERVIQLDDGNIVRTDDQYYDPAGSVQLTPQP